MRFTLAAAAFTLVALHPLRSHAQASDAGAAGVGSDAAGSTATGNDAAGEAGEAPVSKGGSGGASSSGGASGNAGKGGSGGAAPVSAPDPGTDDTNACSVAGPNAPWNLFATSLALGAACLTLRRRRSR